MKNGYQTKRRAPLAWLLSSFMLLAAFAVNAQVATNYTFSSSSGTYTAITGGTVLGTTSNDDQVFNNSTTGAAAPVTNTGFPIGFNFTYNGNVYDKFAVNNNGWIVLGTGTFQAGSNLYSNYTPISSAGPAGYVSAIAALANDMQGQTGSELSYLTIGTAPNRVLVVQWTNFRKYLNTGDNYNFQIRLYETSNIVQIAYGTMTNNTTATTAQVGLRGATNTDFNNRTSTTSWSASAAGTLNNSTMTLSSTVFPASGQLYTWTPVPLCTGTPTAGAITGASSVCSGTGTTLTLTGASAGGGITYQWAKSGTAGGPYTNMGTATTQATGNLSATTYYIVTVTCPNSGLTATTAEFAVNVNALPTITVTPSTASLCSPGGSPVSLTASGGSTYTWTPATALSATTGATVTATPGATTTYTVTGTAAGCSNTATAIVNVVNTPIISSVTAIPPSVCAGGSSQLQVTTLNTSALANTYVFASSTGATLDPMAGATTVLNSNDDDTPTASATAIGFPFLFNGSYYTQYSVSPDGWILLGSGAAASQFTNTTTSTTNIPKIYPYWDDMATGTDGSVKTLVTGTAPNRIFKVQWFVTIPRNTTGAATSTFQAWLYEGSGKIEFRYGTMGPQTAGSASAGLTASATNFQSITFSTNTVSTSTANDNNTGVPASGQMYTFTLPTTTTPGTYAWSPATFLSSTTIANPMATNITASTTYTVSVTNTGCSATGTVSITAGAALTSAATITPGNTVCAGSSITLNGVPTGGGAPYTYSWTGPNSFTSTSQNPTLTATAAAAGTYTVTITDACAATSTAQVTLTVNPTPTVTVSPTTAALCNPGATAATLTAGGASTYVWGPATGLSATTGASVSALPSGTTTYTVTGTAANGCTNTATATINVGNIPVISSVTATPSSVCINGSSQLMANAIVPATVNNYSFATSTGAALDPMTGATTVITNGDDDTPTAAAAAIGFSFNYEGTNYTQYSVSPDGWILLGSGTATSQFTNTTTSTTNTPKIYPYWDDIATGTDGSVKTLVTGTAPNRIFKVQWFVTNPRNTSGAANATFQAWLYETSGQIEFRYGTMGTQTAGSASAGLTGTTSTNYKSVTFSTNTASSTTANDNNLDVPASGRMYTFTPPAISSYAWSPATFLNNTNTSNPTASNITATTTYSVQVTSAIGCQSTGTVTVTSGTALTSAASVNPGNNVCAGTNLTFNAVPTGGGAPYTYSWTGPNGFTSTAQSPVLSSPTAAATGTYSVTITDACAATSVATVSITVNALPAVAVTPTSALYCNPGPGIAITASGASTYTWSPASGLSASTGASVTATPTSTKTYTVTGTDANGCVATATTTITSAPAVTGATASATPATICAGSTTDLSSSAAPFTATAFAEDFESNAAGWNIVNSSTGPNAALTTWVIRNSGYNDPNAYGPFSSNNASKFEMINSDAGGSGSVTKATLTSPSFSTVGLTTASLSFYHYYGYWNTGDTVRVQVSTNNTTWTTVKSYTSNQGTASSFVQDNINLNAYAGQPTVYVRFYYRASWGYFWTIDNVAVTGSASSFTYNWTSSPAGFTSTAQNPTGVAPTATTSYSVLITNPFGCTGTATTNVTVNPLPTVTATAANSAICTGSSTALTASGATTYAWSPATGLSATTGSSVTANPTVTTTYSVTGTDANGCMNNATVALTVNPLPVVTLGAFTPVCIDAAPVTLTGNESPTGGTFSGTAVTGNTFDPSTAGAGTHAITYSYTDANGCSSSATQNITVNPLPVISFTATAPVCSNAAPFTLTVATPSGGTYTGTGISGGMFDPSVAGADTVYYSYTDANGCSSMDTTTIMVNAAPVITLASYTPLCDNATLIALTGESPIGGSYTGNGVVNGNTFDPAVAGAGTHYVVYSYTDASTGCSAMDSTAITVNAAPVITLASYTPVCEDAGMITLAGESPAGGTYSGNGVSGNMFDPSVAGAGTSYVVYSYTDATTGCSSMDSTTITVNALPVITLASYMPVCANGGMVTLAGESPAGGTYSGNGVSGNMFDPSVTGAGTFYVVYSYTDATTGCSAMDSTAIMVNTAPVVTLASYSPVCESAGMVTLAGESPAGGTYSGNGVSGNMFDPSVTGAGTFYVVYSYTDATTGCSAMDSTTITVNAAPVITLASYTPVCEDAGMITLAGESPAGGTYSGNGVSGNMFDPSVAGAGTNYVVYSYTDANNGCTSTDSTAIVVNALPIVNLGSDVTQCGGTVTLNAGNAGSTYSWSTTASTQMITVAASGTYSVLVTNAGQCSASDTVTITINTPAAINLGGNVTMCSGETTTLDAGAGFSSYMWSTTATTQAITVSSAGTYYVTVTNSDNCAATDTVIVTVDPCIGINEADGYAVTVLPNPSEGVFTLSISKAEIAQLTIDIIDMQGQLVYSNIEKNISGDYSKQINITDLAKGVYYLRLNTGARVITNKLIVQ